MTFHSYWDLRFVQHFIYNYYIYPNMCITLLPGCRLGKRSGMPDKQKSNKPNGNNP